MHERNMLWKAHDFLAYARQPRTAQTSIHHPDAGTGPGPLEMQKMHPKPTHFKIQIDPHGNGAQGGVLKPLFYQGKAENI